jgi:DNA-binding FrmR family transcriptional regulator
MASLADIQNLSKLQDSGSGQVAGLTEMAAADETTRQENVQIAAATQSLEQLARQ